MNKATEQFDFENAAKYRDYISAIKSLLNNKKVVEFTEENKNIALVQYLEEGIFKFFLIKGNSILFSRKYSISNYATESLTITLRNNILYYFGSKSLNNLIQIGKDEIDEISIIYTYLKNKQNNCKFVVVSDKWIDDKSYTIIDEALNTLI